MAATMKSTVDVTSRFHSLTRILANKRRKLALMPVNSSYRHPACYTTAEIPVGGVHCESMLCGF